MTKGQEILWFLKQGYRRHHLLCLRWLQGSPTNLLSMQETPLVTVRIQTQYRFLLLKCLISRQIYEMIRQLLQLAKLELPGILAQCKARQY